MHASESECSRLQARAFGFSIQELWKAGLEIPGTDCADAPSLRASRLGLETQPTALPWTDSLRAGDNLDTLYVILSD